MSARVPGLLVAALCFAAVWLAPDVRPVGHGAEARASMGALQRSLGPVASVAASVEWVRYQSALQAGDPALAYGHAWRAIELDPRSAEGWFELAQHLVFTRGSFLEDDAPATRRRWIQAGLEVLEQGEARCAQPEELAYLAGMIRFAYLAGIADEDLAWPGGAAALHEQAARDFERAARLGREDALEALAAVERERPR